VEVGLHTRLNFTYAIHIQRVDDKVGKITNGTTLSSTWASNHELNKVCGLKKKKEEKSMLFYQVISTLIVNILADSTWSGLWS
jgi:hypothetical protein